MFAIILENLDSIEHNFNYMDQIIENWEKEKH